MEKDNQKDFVEYDEDAFKPYVSTLRELTSEPVRFTIYQRYAQLLDIGDRQSRRSSAGRTFD
ncbi:hypothetical protein KW791_00635 [Candidatus Parcubacteria bacterium]|nr:hypothetical protein [Candidatus Parcubacteria bacterium]